MTKSSYEVTRVGDEVTLKDIETGFIMRWAESAVDFAIIDKGTLKGQDYIRRAQEMTDWAYSESLLQPATMETIERYHLRHSIGNKLYNARVEKKLTQQQLSELTGIGQGYIARIEGGRINATLDVINKIASALNVRIDLQITDRQ
ncbi:helix-turn-helix transcriptional regulator [uncultured Duncaniella sp.]|uniref:helix-turn-helix domain-containing protein n=1 Tax=uncultured Duncaniella sp. TaxID=2768039 RepID=UPI0025A65828|nr:helix-turn-helix transcriptional regulator [uncultured Duncaniella sp.]